MGAHPQSGINPVPNVSFFFFFALYKAPIALILVAQCDLQLEAIKPEEAFSSSAYWGWKEWQKDISILNSFIKPASRKMEQQFPVE